MEIGDDSPRGAGDPERPAVAWVGQIPPGVGRGGGGFCVADSSGASDAARHGGNRRTGAASGAGPSRELADAREPADLRRPVHEEGRSVDVVRGVLFSDDADGANEANICNDS